jgi:parvulin-like peptidyl-prolyl isomerase
MQRHLVRAAAVVSVLSLAACSGLKDALTAHVDTVARAGGQELTVQQLSQMMTAAKAPARKDVALAIANIWVNYQLLGAAAARGDSLMDQKSVDDGMWAQVAQMRMRKLFAAVSKNMATPDEATLEKHYNDGDLLAARHILFMARKNVVKPAERDSAKREAEKVAKMVTPANFAAMAKKYSSDPGSKQSGGELGVFPRGRMVPEFEQGVLSLKPGQISGPVESDFGYHIIMRLTWADAKPKFSEVYSQFAEQKAESTYSAQLEKNAKIEVKPAAAKTIRAIATDLDAYRNDHTDIASGGHVDMTADKVAKWMAAYPPQAQIREKLQQLPDSVMGLFAKQLVVNELMLRAADSAKIALDSGEKANIRMAFQQSVMNSFGGLNITPKSLADSAKSTSDREKLAAARIGKYMDDLLANKAQYVDVSEPVSRVLRSKFEARVLSTGIDRAVSEAQKAAARADSAVSKAMPKSAVPSPAAPSSTGGSAAPAQQPAAQPAAPQPAKKP